MYSWGEEASLLELPLNAGTSGHPGGGGCVSDSTPQHGVPTLQANILMGGRSLSSGITPQRGNQPSSVLMGGGGTYDWTPQHGVPILQANGLMGEGASLLELPLNAGTSGPLYGGGGFVSDSTPQHGVHGGSHSNHPPPCPLCLIDSQPKRPGCMSLPWFARASARSFPTTPT